MNEPKLYGLVNSNRLGDDLWGKNQFNSTFPAAICCYMRDQSIKPVYVAINNDFTHRTTDTEINISDVFGTTSTGTDIRFEFESAFQPFQQFTFDDDGPGAIDLVIATDSRNQLKPLEIKLTVLPDNSTASLRPELWSCELVVRPITSAYATIQICSNVIEKGLSSTVRSIVEPTASAVQDWNNQTEIQTVADDIVNSLIRVAKQCTDLQHPFLVQPIWKTLGKSPQLATQSFDVFVWSDLAIWKLFIEAAQKRTGNRITQALRECTRTIRCIYELVSIGKIRYSSVYQGMSLGNQTSKAFALSGRATLLYMKHSRLLSPVLGRNILPEIILNSGEDRLSPERRFDAAVYFTAKEIMRRQTSQT